MIESGETRLVAAAKKYYACLFRLDGIERHIIWYSFDTDGLVREDAQIIAFPSTAALRAYADQRGFALEKEAPPVYDWDALERWCAKPAGSEVDPDRILHRRSAGLYDKLFRSNNLPAMTPPGAEYYPTWTGLEMRTLASILQLGIAELRQQLDG